MDETVTLVVSRLEANRLASMLESRAASLLGRANGPKPMPPDEADRFRADAALASRFAAALRRQD